MQIDQPQTCITVLSAKRNAVQGHLGHIDRKYKCGRFSICTVKNTWKRRCGFIIAIFYEIGIAESNANVKILRHVLRMRSKDVAKIWQEFESPTPNPKEIAEVLIL